MSVVSWTARRRFAAVATLTVSHTVPVAAARRARHIDRSSSTLFDRVSPLTLASRSPQRRAILEQLGVEFTVVSPHYVEDDALAVPPEELVVTHAVGKARAVEGLY